jgi:rod shape-determining protein MreD
VRRAAFSAGLLLLAILIQVSVLDNLRLPGGAGPDLVLVVVVALALTGGPVEGMLGGFCAGLALDVAPPATHLVGQYALVFCLVGYAAGRVGSHLDESAWVPIGVVAVGSAAGELLFALTGMIFGNLDITWSAVGHVLPASVVYDVLLSPFVLYAVVRARALAAPPLAAQGLASFPGGSASGGAPGQPRGVPGLAGAAALFGGSGAVLRDSGTGNAPRLKARALRAGSTQGGSASGSRPARPRPSRPVEMKFSGGGGSALSSRPAAAARAAQGLAARPVNLHLGSRRRFSQHRGSRPGATPAQGSWQRGGGIPASSLGRTSAFSRTGAFGRTSTFSRARGGGIPAGAFSRARGGLGDGAGGRALRPSRGPRLRGGVMQGGSASGARAVGVRFGARPARPVYLRLGAGRRSDGAIGGSALGRRPRGGGPGAGKQHVPRFRGAKAAARGGLGTGKQHVPRFRGAKAAARGGPGAGKQHTPRFRGAKPGSLSGRRAPASALNGRRTFGRRRSLWRVLRKRSGGLTR